MSKENERENGRRPRGFLILRAAAMPKDTNPKGDIFGGWILAQMDIAGGMMADEIAGGRTVTVAVEKMVFKLPVRAGETVSIHGTLLQIGNSSMDISIEVWAKPLSGEFRAERHLVTEGIFRYVAIDDRGRPRSVPDNWRCFSGSNDIS